MEHESWKIKTWELGERSATLRVKLNGLLLGLLLSANKNIVLAYQDYQLKNVNPIRTSFEMPQNSLDCFTFKNINCMF